MSNGPAQHFLLKISIDFFVCMCMCLGGCTPWHLVWSWGAGVFLPLCVFGELNAGHQAWWQVLYLISHLPSPCSTFPKEKQDICFWRYGLPLEIKIKTKKLWCVHVYDVWVVVVGGQFYGALSCRLSGFCNKFLHLLGHLTSQLVCLINFLHVWVPPAITPSLINGDKFQEKNHSKKTICMTTTLNYICVSSKRVEEMQGLHVTAKGSEARRSWLWQA